MKKFLCAAVFVAVGFCSVVSLGGCKAGAAHVDFTLSEDGTYYIVSGVSGDKQGLEKYDVPAEYAEEGGELLPVKEIGYEAFFQCSSLYRVTIPDTVEIIGERAFAMCKFSEFTIPDGVKEIRRGAFGMCEVLTEITIPESVTVLDYQAFYCCSKLEKAVIKANITELPAQVFYNSVVMHGGNPYTDTALTEVYLPATLQKIHSTALYGNFLTDVYVAGGEEHWENIYFYEMELKAGTENEYVEKVVEKSAALPAVDIHPWDL